ncbi:MAG: transporter substrate-binding domain-containing protein [Bacteroidales bacterium]|nr:transporter substrate-binding domain-containing protein [Bacteroidales bacterium]
MNLKSFKSILVIVLLCSSFNSFGNYNRTDTIFFKGNYDYPPYELLDEKLNPTGFSIDILRAIEKTMGLHINIELTSWNKARYELEDGKIDGVAAMSYSQERNKVVNFSTPYVYITHAVFIREDSKIKSFEDISNKQIIVVKGDIMHDYLLSNGISKYLIPVKNYQTALRLLSVGEYDCAVINKLQGQFAITEYNLINLNPVGTPIQPSEMCFGIRKDNIDLLAQINDGLQILKSTGEYDKIYDKWFGIYEEADIKTRVLKIIAWILIPFLLIILAILVWSWSLKKQVGLKTAELQKELIERKNTEKQLTHEKSLLNSMINSIPDLIFYKNKKNVYIGCNDAFCNFNNLSSDQIIGKSDFEIFPLNEAINYSETDKTVIENNKIIQTESWETNTNGDNFLLSTLKVPFNDNQGKPLGIVGICHDITERYKNEIDLKKAKEKAEESDRLKSSFLANMSHEIRTPMNAIIGFSDLLVDSNIDYDEREELVTHINNNCNTLLLLIDDIIDLAKIEANELSIFKKDTNIKDILNELYNTLSETKKKLNRQSIEIIIDKKFLNNNFILNTDPFRFKQIMINLINNALKYTEEGHVEIGYNVIKNLNTVEFFVKDTGIGIPKNKQKEIFDRFNKIEPSNAKLYRGTGLGLTITQNLVERLGGKINVDSELNVGSVFHFNLPLEKDVNSIYIDQKEISIFSNDNWIDKSILIVEDEESNFKFLEMLLNNRGLILIRAHNGHEAIEICKTNDKLDLVLMDIKMPGMNGLDATRQIKKIKTNLPIIAQSAYAMQNDEEICLEAGCDDYITKPIRKDYLFGLINKWLT